jgi:hypothetical protein
MRSAALHPIGTLSSVQQMPREPNIIQPLNARGRHSGGLTHV